MDRRPEFVADPVTPPTEREPVSRRRFLSLVGASAALAATAACVPADSDTIVAYTKKPDDVVPGVANYYASTYQEGLEAYGVLVKAREGRPIHIDGNDEHPVYRGKTSLRAQAETIGLYDPERLRAPRVAGKASSWKAADARVVPALKAAAAGGKPVLLLTAAAISPSRRAVIADLKRAVPGLQHVAWEPAVSASERTARQALYGDAAAPRAYVDRATVILAFDADFMGGMEGAVPAIAGFAEHRQPTRPGQPMSRLYALESRLSLTGSKADTRVPLRPSAAAPVAFALANALHARHAVPLPAGLDASVLAPFTLSGVARQYALDGAVLSALADDLAGAARSALVLAGPSLPVEAHAAAALLNTMLDAEGHTLDAAYAADAAPLTTPAEMAAITRDLGAGKYAAAIFWEANPSYAVADGAGFGAAMAHAPLTVRMGLHDDETASRCDVVLPVNHWLESWNDFEPSADLLAVQQPLIRPLYDTRQGEEILLGWARALGAPVEADYRTYLMARWQREVYPKGAPVTFDRYWTAAVHDGALRRDAKPRAARVLRGDAVAAAARTAAAAKPGAGLELLLAPDVRLWDGRYGNNGWLQELPEPVTKVCWGNNLAMSSADAAALGVTDGDLVSVSAGGREVKLPVLVQPGQAPGAVFAALGFGRVGGVSGGRGANTFALAADDGSAPFHRAEVKVRRAGGREPLVRTQTEFGLHGRELTALWTLEEYGKKAGPPAGSKPLPTLNDPLEWPDHKWAMTIDLSTCVGCGGCEIACQSENNVPVVGPEQVGRGRTMHWIRGDVYYVGDGENPRVAHQPMLCQQCDDAPCEPVCPVAATQHSADGLNEQIYNRCIGVRYCAANCPYMVRRFNFFDYTSTITDPLDLAFNPEVTVRPRGVMEKCTFCVQRIRNGVQIAKDEGRALRDGEIQPACAAACPANAIVFGDITDRTSRVARAAQSDRGFKVLEDLGVRPAITYLAELRNPAAPKTGGIHD
ncbi:MAG: 4Fe-4S dicluster domain-containing protein [Gemmatimonadota bacterium]|nr:4Fe-4S dicluster domain-containing protein [Gemmatimonadota bacterium]